MEDYFTTDQKDWYNITYYIEAYDKLHSTCDEYASSDGCTSLIFGSTTEELVSLGHTLIFIGKWLQSF